MIADKVGEAARLAESKVKGKKPTEEPAETIGRGDDGKVNADVGGFGPGPAKPSGARHTLGGTA